MKAQNRTRRRKRRAKTKVAADSTNASRAQATGAALDAHFNVYFASPVERIEHDLNLELVTDDRYRAAEKFVHACEKVGVWRLMQGDLSGDAGHHIDFLAREIAHSIRVLIGRGDLMLARQLPPIVELLQSAMQTYGSKITARVTKRLPIEQLLKKHKARELLAMLAALYPDWDKIHHVHDREAIELMSEVKLRELLLSKECWTRERDGKLPKEWRKYRLSPTIENIVAMREGEGKTINLFVEHLWRGRLWGLGPEKSVPYSGKTFVDCPWKGSKDLPARGNVRDWMKIVMPFLRAVTKERPMRLDVFEHMLAARRFVYRDATGKGHGRLAGDSVNVIWNQIETEIRKAWETMAKQTS